MWKVAAMTGAALMVSAGQAATSGPSAQDLTPAVKAFLAGHGDLCLAWYTWPRELTADEQQTGRNEAVQLPVLERLGIVRSTPLVAPAATKTALEAEGVDSSAPLSSQLAPAPTLRYSLTAKGQLYYLKRKHETLGAHGQPEQHDGDFCVAHLTLDKVVKWSPPEVVHGHRETLVHYTYRIKAAEWMSDPAAREVFPVVDRIIRGQGKLLMSATAQQYDGKWVPVLPGQ